MLFLAGSSASSSLSGCLDLGMNWCGPDLGHCWKVWASRCIDRGAALVRMGLIPMNDKLFYYGSPILSPELCICYLLHDNRYQGGFWSLLDAKLDLNSFEEMEMMPLCPLFKTTSFPSGTEAI